MRPIKTKRPCDIPFTKEKVTTISYGNNLYVEIRFDDISNLWFITGLKKIDKERVALVEYHTENYEDILKLIEYCKYDLGIKKSGTVIYESI